MDAEHLITFNVVLLAAIMSPGPALLVAMRTTLASGRGAGMATGFGLDIVFDLFPWAYGAVRTVGAIYLVYVAWRMWAGARQAVATEDALSKRAFRQGMAINLLNPKSVLFAAAVLIVIFPATLTTGERLVVVANHLIVEFLFYTLLAYLMASPLVRDGYVRAKLWTDRFAAIVLGALGLRLLLGR